MNLLQILVMVSLNDDEKMRLESYLFAKYLFTQNPSKEQLEIADVIIGNPSKEQLRACRKLKWLQLMSAGSDEYAKDPMFQTVYLTNASGTYGISICEHLLGSLLFQFRQFQTIQAKQRQHEWAKVDEIRSISGCNILIVGLGDIGSTFAKVVYDMGAYTIGIRKHTSKRLPFIDEQYTLDAIDDLLPRCDVVVLCLPHGEETTHILNRERFQKMKPNAIVMNVGRGSAIDSDALVEALQEKRIGGACLDVFEVEPLPSNHLLWDMENVFISSHLAGVWNCKATRNRFLCLVKENLERFSIGKGLLNMVDLQSGYREYIEDYMFE